MGLNIIPPSKLVEWLQNREINHKFLEFEQPVRSVAQACEQTGHQPESFVKTMVFTSPEKGTIACIIPGDKKLSQRKLGQFLDVKPDSLRICKPEEVTSLLKKHNNDEEFVAAYKVLEHETSV